MSARPPKPSRTVADRLKALSRQRLSQPQDGSLYNAPPRKRARWLEVPRVSQPPEFQPGDRSILLDPLNPIQHPRSFEHTKQPVSRVYSRLESRRMDENERHIHANPYLRMIASPVRLCSLSGRQLPAAFMLRMSIQKVPLDPEERAKQQAVGNKDRFHTDGQGNIIALLPDNSPTTQSRVGGHGIWVVCNRSLFNAIPYKGLRATDKRIELHPQLLNLISTQLRQRVLDELDELVAHLGVGPLALASQTIIRRLTWDEWHSAQTSGVLRNEPNAHAVLVFRIGAIRRRKKTDPLPREGDPDPTRIRLPPPPAPSVTFLRRGPDGSAGKAPLYDAAAYFPDDKQRESLRKKIHALLNIEFIGRRRARMKDLLEANETVPENSMSLGDEMHSRSQRAAPLSNAYVVSSSADTVLRADSAPIFIALWRLRMWEDFHKDFRGNSWEFSKDVTEAL